MIRIAPAFALLAALGLPAAASAQQSISVGQTVSGTLTSADPTLDDDSHFRLYRVQLSAGQRVRVTLRSDDFDAYLAMAEGVLTGGECEEGCETDDDGAGGTDSRIDYRARNAGTHTIRVNTLSEGETGDFTLSVETDTRPVVVDRPRGEITVGQTVSGSLDEGDPRAADDSFYETWSFRAPFSGRVVIEQRSEDFDAYLSIGRGSGDEWEDIESDDDSLGGTDSRLEVTVEAGMVYSIRANSLSEGETGGYTLTVRRVD